MLSWVEYEKRFITSGPGQVGDAKQFEYSIILNAGSQLFQQICNIGYMFKPNRIKNYSNGMTKRRKNGQRKDLRLRNKL